MDGFTCPPEHKHEQTSTCRNQHQCSCEPCVIGKREYNFWLKHMVGAGRKAPRVVDGTGTRRRLQSLAALGWSTGVLAEQLGTIATHVQAWRRSDRVTVQTADRVRAVYDSLAMSPPVAVDRRGRQTITRAQNDAARWGWVPPLAWDDDTIDDPSATPAVAEEMHGVDDIAVQLSIDGARPFLTQEERRLVVAHLHRMRWSDPRIASHIGHVASKTIARDRKALGLEAWPTNELAADERGAA